MIDYIQVLAELHASLRPRTYLEIGVYQGDSLRLALPETLVVGVDPEPALEEPAEDRWVIEVSSSDDFFAGTRPQEIFGTRPVDLVFIDGMHLFEYALRDFANAESLTGPRSVIALHDCLPISAETATRERATAVWTGDVWKLVLCLLDRRPDLDLSIIEAPPSGLLLVRGVNAQDSTLRAGYEALVEEYGALQFEAWLARRDEVLQRTTRSGESRVWKARYDAEQAERERLLDYETELLGLRDEYARLHALATEREAEIGRLRDAISAAEADLRSSAERLSTAEAEISALREQLEASERTAIAVAAQLDAVAASASWRVTAPLRRVGGLVRRDGDA